MRSRSHQFRWSTSWQAPIILTVLAFLATSINASAQDMRTWTDSTGKHKIKAKFVSVAEGKVTLEQDNGDQMDIELKKLSLADQRYVADQQKAEADNPFKKKSAPSPFQKKSTGGSTKTEMPSRPGTASKPATGGAEPGLTEVDWSKARTVAIAPASTEWKVPVSNAEPPAPPAKLRPVALPAKTNFFEGAKAFLVNADGTRAVVGYETTFGDKVSSRLVLCDLENGKTLGSGGLQNTVFLAMALSDDGNQVLMRSNGNNDKHGRLELWELTKSGVSRGLAWEPYGDAKDNEKGVRWAAFLDANRVATCSEGGKLVVWKLDPLEPEYTLQTQGGCNPGLSADRKLLAFTDGKVIGVLTTDEGEVLALKDAPFPNMAWTSFSFSPSGKRLLCQVFVSRMFVYDVATGAPYRELPMMGLNPGENPTIWPDEDHLLVGANTLVDLESQVRLWTYQGAEKVREVNGLVWFEVAGDQNRQGALVPAKLPQPGIQDALKKALADPNFFIVRSGSSVTIDLNGIGDASQRPTVEKALIDNLAKIGVRVAPGSQVVVQCSITPGKPEEIAYRSIGMGFPKADKFTITPQIGKISFLYQGKPAWETSASTVPFMDFAHLEKNESLADHVRKFEKPNYAWFGHVELPKLLTRPTGQGNAGTLGTSQVSVAGVR